MDVKKSTSSLSSALWHTLDRRIRYVSLTKELAYIRQAASGERVIESLANDFSDWALESPVDAQDLVQTGLESDAISARRNNGWLVYFIRLWCYHKISNLSSCNGQYVDTQHDAQNCGACGMVCASGQQCSNGQCAASSDAESCGSCGMACSSGRCSNRECAASNAVQSGGWTCVGGNCTANATTPTPVGAVNCHSGHCVGPSSDEFDTWLEDSKTPVTDPASTTTTMRTPTEKQEMLTRWSHLLNVHVIKPLTTTRLLYLLYTLTTSTRRHVWPALVSLWCEWMPLPAPMSALPSQVNSTANDENMAKLSVAHLHCLFMHMWNNECVSGQLRDVPYHTSFWQNWFRYWMDLQGTSKTSKIQFHVFDFESSSRTWQWLLLSNTVPDRQGCLTLSNLYRVLAPFHPPASPKASDDPALLIRALLRRVTTTPLDVTSSPELPGAISTIEPSSPLIIINSQTAVTRAFAIDRSRQRPRIVRCVSDIDAGRQWHFAGADLLSRRGNNHISLVNCTVAQSRATMECVIQWINVNRTAQSTLLLSIVPDRFDKLDVSDLGLRLADGKSDTIRSITDSKFLPPTTTVQNEMMRHELAVQAQQRAQVHWQWTIDILRLAIVYNTPFQIANDTSSEAITGMYLYLEAWYHQQPELAWSARRDDMWRLWKDCQWFQGWPAVLCGLVAGYHLVHWHEIVQFVWVAPANGAGRVTVNQAPVAPVPVAVTGSRGDQGVRGEAGVMGDIGNGDTGILRWQFGASYTNGQAVVDTLGAVYVCCSSSAVVSFTEPSRDAENWIELVTSSTSADHSHRFEPQTAIELGASRSDITDDPDSNNLEPQTHTDASAASPPFEL